MCSLVLFALAYYNTIGCGNTIPAINFSYSTKFFRTGFYPSLKEKNAFGHKNQGHISDFQRNLALTSMAFRVCDLA